MKILEKKNLKITKEDMLFKLALHYRNHRDGPKPDFDVDRYIQDYKGRYKKFDRLSRLVGSKIVEPRWHNATI
jgi:hypothetical protein